MTQPVKNETANAISIVIATRNRADELVRTVERLCALPGEPAIIVVDNASRDATVDRVRRLGDPRITVIELARNKAAAARNIGVEVARTPFVAFSDDDSWWDHEALTTALKHFDAHPRLGLIAATTLVGEGNVPDPVVADMADSPLGRRPSAAGPAVLGFLACSAVVRTKAFKEANGFSELLHFGAEETLLAYDMAAAGWELCHVPEVIAHHHPSEERMSRHERARLEARNNTLISCMRRPPVDAATAVLGMAWRSIREPAMLPAWVGLASRLPGALLQRRRLPRNVEQQIALLEDAR